MTTGGITGLVTATALFIMSAQAANWPGQEWESFETGWECYQSASSTVPVSSRLNFKIKLDSGELDFSELKELIEKAKGNPKTDYFGCLQFAVEEMYRVAWNWCWLRKTKPKFCENPSALGKSFVEADKALARYGAFAVGENAISPVEPALPVAPKLPLGKLIAMKQRLRNCQTIVNMPEFLDSEFLERELPAIVKDPGTCTRGMIARDYLLLLGRAEMSSKQCQAEPERCKQRRASIKRALGALAKAGLGAELGEAPKLDMPLPSCPPDGTALLGIAEQIMRNDKVTGCVKQLESDPFGEVIGTNGRYVGTPISQPGYHLWRAADEALSEDFERDDGTTVKAGTKVPVYHATVKYGFFPEGLALKQDGSNFDYELQKKYLERAQSCLNAEPIKSKLRGPNGERLELKVVGYDPKEKPTNESPPLRRVDIPAAGKEIRSNSRLWDPRLGDPEKKDTASRCATILHETLHVLGLVDEYEETSSGCLVTPAGEIDCEQDLQRVSSAKGSKFAHFDCRVIGPFNSIMASETMAFFSVADRFKVTNCECQSGTRACKAAVSKLKPGASACPKSSAKAERYVDAATAASIKAGTHESGNGSFVLSVEKLKSPRNSLLYPAHFRQITSPGCLDENRLYLLCARDAYTTSRGHYGKNTCSVGLPKECSKGSKEWLR